MELHVGRGKSAGALTVFPVWNGDGGQRRYGTNVADVVVTEAQGGPSVPTLHAVNGSQSPVLILEGFLFEGGWQHRMATKSVILAPGRPMDIEVACVEQRRWGGGARQASRGRRATPFVHSGVHAAPAGVDVQSEVWRRVDTYGVGREVAGTGSLVGYLDRAGRDVTELVHDLRPLPGQSGLVVAISGQPLMLEVFDDPQTLREQFDSIIAAAGLDALGQPPVVTPSRRARRMVERLDRVSLQPVEDLEVGSRLGGRSDDLDVSVLSWEDRAVHLRATNLRHPHLVGA